ncbi:MAG: ROK family protein [Truepera sp.]|nr:ROK family protein [Truepera sp.]
MTRHVIAMDVGGTSLTTGLVRQDGQLTNLSRTAIDSSGTAEELLRAFTDALKSCLARAQVARLTPVGIGIAICGPFDYQRGISLMQNLGKYDHLYGVNVKQELRYRLALPPSLPLVFDVDSWSFARGQAWLGAARHYRRFIAFTIGSGVGSAFVVDGEVVADGPGVPPLGWISGQPYQDGILDHYVGRHHLIARYQALTGLRLEVAEIAQRARQGEAEAASVFSEVATTLGNFIRERHVIPFGAECLVFGGRIAQSFALLRPALRQALKGVSGLKAILAVKNSVRSSLQGVTRLVLILPSGCRIR